MIPDEAVEAAARAVYGNGPRAWIDENPRVRARYLAEALLALEAAAPHIQADAWNVGYGYGRNGDFDNPYRTAK